MNKIFAVARAEYLQAIRSKAFIIGVLMMPVLMGGSILIQLAFKDQVDLDDRKCAIYDASGELYEMLATQVERHNQNDIFEEGDDGEPKQVRPRFVLEPFQSETELRVDVELSKRVDSGDLIAFLMIGEDVVRGPSEGDAAPDLSLAYYTETPTYTELARWIERTINEEVRQRRYAAAELDLEIINRLDTKSPLQTFGLAYERSDGSVEEAERESKMRTFGVPALSMFMLFMLIFSSAPALMNQVLEEKMQRISEVLVSAVTPFQLMFGKLVGSVMVSMTLAAIYLGSAAWATHHYEVAHFVPGVLYLWIPLFLTLALFMYGSIFSALGSACSELRDAQSMMMPAMVLVMIPVFAWSVVLENPNGSVATALTLWPTSTPLILLLRVAAPPGPPLWELIVGLLGCVAATIVTVAISGKIFRIGVLSQGQSPTMRQLVSWVFSK
ncbi:MAG: ABC-2 type transport system permease protein [Planctomycetota bacterium]|jgi:ABC-2 type transport system permease protein